MRRAWLAILVFCALSLFAQDKEYFLRVRMVRHGQPGVAGTDFTPEDKAAWSVLGLTPLGRKQVETTGAFMKKEGVKWRVIASPQERAAETADIICSHLDTTYTLEPKLREVGNAISEMLPNLRKRFTHIDTKETLELSPEERKRFKENNEECGKRGKEFIMTLLKTSLKNVDCGPVLLVTHGHFMRCTIETMTGEAVLPWNCGMAELLVWPDGRVQLDKGNPLLNEVLSPDLITCNYNFFHKDPWFIKFMPYSAPRPEPIPLVNFEYQEYVNDRRSSWRHIRPTTVEQIKRGDGQLTLTGRKNNAVVLSPRFPLAMETEYVCTMEVHGHGKAVCKLVGNAANQPLELTPESKTYEFKFSAKKEGTFVSIRLEAQPESELVLTRFTLQGNPINK